MQTKRTLWPRCALLANMVFSLQCGVVDIVVLVQRSVIDGLVITQCYSGIFSTPGLHAASGWSCWWGRRRPSPSPCETPLADGGGRSWRNGCVLVHENLAWRVAVEPAWTLNRGLSRLSISSTFTAIEVTEDGTEMVAAERKLPP